MQYTKSLHKNQRLYTLFTFIAMSVAEIPITQMKRLITGARFSLSFKNFGLMIFQVPMDEADKIDESALLITAAAKAPNPIVAIKLGARYFNVCGKIIAELSGSGTPSAVQSVIFPIIPTSTAGKAARIQKKPAPSDRFLAVFGSFAERTL